MARQKALCIPSLVTTFIALVLLLLVTISLPLTFHDSTPLSIVDASNLGGLRDVTGNGANADRNITAIRFGLWGICSKGTNESSYAYCSDNDHEYNITLALSGNDAQAAYQQRSINTSWTRGLVVAVVAFVFTIIGLILSLPPHLIVQLIAALWLLLTLVITLVGFIIQIVFFVYTRSRIHDLTPDASVMPGAGFYMTLISLPLLLFSALTVACGWRKERNGGGADSSMSSGGGGFMSRAKRPFGGGYGRRSKSATDSSIGKGTNGVEEDNKNSIPLTSRQRVLDAFNKS